MIVTFTGGGTLHCFLKVLFHGLKEITFFYLFKLYLVIQTKDQNHQLLVPVFFFTIEFPFIYLCNVQDFLILSL